MLLKGAVTDKRLIQYGRKTMEEVSTNTFSILLTLMHCVLFIETIERQRPVGLHLTLNQILSLSGDSSPLDYIILAISGFSTQ